MKKAIFAAAFIAVVAGSAQAGETGVINQAGPYEATMQFYLHPAQGFAGSPRESTPATVAQDTPNVESKPQVKHIASAHPGYKMRVRETVYTQANSK